MTDGLPIAGLAAEELEQLADALADRIADRLRELLEAAPDEWVSAAEIARRFSLSVDAVYEHADELGARRLGDGPKARLRFDPATVARALTSRSDGNGSQPAGSPPASADSAPARRRRRAPGAQRVPLIPIRGAKE